MGKDRGDIMHKVWRPDRIVLLETKNSSTDLAQRLHWWVWWGMRLDRK